MTQVIDPVPEAPARTSMTGHATASRKGLFSWTLYEFAYGPFFITFVMFIFSPYFQLALVGDEVRGQALWGYTATVAGLSIAILSPILGALNDAMGPRKPAVALFSAICFVALCLLWFAKPSMPHAVGFAMVAYIVAAISSEIAGVFHNSMLPNIVSDKRIGALSGAGYAMSYLAAVSAFAIWFMMFQAPDVPAFGIADDARQRVMAPFSALWMFVFVLPFFIFTRDLPHSGRKTRAALAHGLAGLGKTLRSLGHYRNVAIFMIARLVYYDGMMAIFTFVAVYAAGYYGWGPEKMMFYAVAMLSVGFFSSIAGGALDDLIGSKRTLLISVFMFGFFLAVGLSITPELVPWLPASMQTASSDVPLIGPLLQALGFAGLPERWYFVCGIFSTFFVGPALASSRTMLSRIIPTDKTAEFFGLYNLTGKLTAFMGPLAIGLATQITNSQRAGMGVIFIFLFVGAGLLLFVKEERTHAHD